MHFSCPLLQVCIYSMVIRRDTVTLNLLISVTIITYIGSELVLSHMDWTTDLEHGYFIIGLENGLKNRDDLKSLYDHYGVIKYAVPKATNKRQGKSRSLGLLLLASAWRLLRSRLPVISTYIGQLMLVSEFFS